jgi:vitamin B12 transporter
MRRYWLVVLLLASWTAGSSHATDHGADSLRVYRLPEVAVTATRVPEDVSNVGGNVSVVDSAQLRNLRPSDLGEVLQTLPAVSLVESGWWGQLGTARIRGMRSQQVLILRDGIPLSNPQNGVVDLNLVSTGAVQQIEVVRGGLSGLYGANALGGAVNIISPDIQTARPRAQVLLETASYESRRREGEFSRGIGPFFGLYVFGGTRETRGSRPNSDYEASDLSTRASFRLPGNWRADLQTFRYHGELGIPGAIDWPSPRARQEDGRFDVVGSIRGSLGAPRNFTLKVYRQDIGFAYRDPDAFLVTEENDRCLVYGADLQQTILDNGPQRLIAGAEVRRSDLWLRTTFLGAQERRSERLWTAGGYVTDMSKIGDRTRILTAIRVDHHALYGENWSPLLNVRVKLGAGLSAFGCTDASFRAPTYNELFYPGSGNRLLEPERGNGWEGGIEARWSAVSWTVSQFRRDIEGQIIWQPVDPQNPYGAWEPRNVQRSRSTGTEVSAGIEPWNALRFSLSISRARNTDRSTRKSLSYVPEFVVKAALEYSGTLIPDRLRAVGRFGCDYVGPRFAGTDETNPLPQHLVLHALGQLLLGDASFYLKAENLANEDYVTQLGYPMPPRTITAGMCLVFWD